METAVEYPTQSRLTVEQVDNGAGLFSGETVRNILKLILDGSPLSEVMTIITLLVESQAAPTVSQNVAWICY